MGGAGALAPNPRCIGRRSRTAGALSLCPAVPPAPAAVPLRPGGKHWEIFSQLCQAVAATANDVPDAYHAALAVENGATWITNDRGYAKFPNLQWRSPFDGM